MEKLEKEVKVLNINKVELERMLQQTGAKKIEEGL